MTKAGLTHLDCTVMMPQKAYMCVSDCFSLKKKKKLETSSLHWALMIGDDSLMQKSFSVGSWITLFILCSTVLSPPTSSAKGTLTQKQAKRAKETH